MNKRESLRAALVLGLTLLLPQSAAAALGNGHYQFEVELAPLCLDGAYPFTVGNIDNAILRVTTDSRGKLSGQVDLRAIKTNVTGKIATTRNGIILTLKGTDRKMPFRVRATLQGNTFVGTATSKGKVACTMDVSAAAALVTAYDLTLVADARSQVSGTGTATTCRQSIPVIVSGLSTEERSTLRITGEKTTWIGNGPPTDTGFIAKWRARGFGAAMKGENLFVQAE